MTRKRLYESTFSVIACVFDVFLFFAFVNVRICISDGRVTVVVAIRDALFVDVCPGRAPSRPGNRVHNVLLAFFPLPSDLPRQPDMGVQGLWKVRLMIILAIQAS